MRRIHVPALSAGNLDLSPSQAHHLRDVLRLKVGAIVQVFDNTGNTADATITEISPKNVALLIEHIHPPADNRFHLTIASAIPKSARADWMIEKLSEIGVDLFIPLATARGVALPEGSGKMDRWTRLSEESAKQSRRTGVMHIRTLTRLADLLSEQRGANRQIWHLSTDPAAKPLITLAGQLPETLTLLIGPEGGWTKEEIEMFAKTNIHAARLTDTVLRIETAAIAAAAVIMSMRG